jgi:hypothetical protein
VSASASKAKRPAADKGTASAGDGVVSPVAEKKEQAKQKLATSKPVKATAVKQQVKPVSLVKIGSTCRYYNV